MNSVLLFIFSVLVSEVKAVRLAMEPQNRVFLGSSWSDGGLGSSLGLESRLTQMLYINMGAFFTFSENIGDNSSTDSKDWITMQHAIWAAPGWRIPHRYKEDSWNWDVIFRGGFACVFSADSYREDLQLVDPAGLTGLDLYLRRGDFGLRSTSKIFFYQPSVSKTLSSISAKRLQSSIELFWQWD